MKFTQQNFLNLKGDPDILVEQWHTSYSQQDLHTFMGLSAEEYAVWVTNPCILDLVAFLRGQVSEFSIEWEILWRSRLIQSGYAGTNAICTSQGVSRHYRSRFMQSSETKCI